MATTSRSEQRSRPASGQGASRLPTRQRRPGLIALAVLLIVGCGLAGGYLFVRGSGKVEVLAVSRPVTAGHTLTAADLTTTSVAGMPSAIPATKMSTVVGEQAVSALVRGEVLLPAMVTGAVVPKPGQALVGVTVKPGQMPAGGLRPGDVVTAVLASSGGDGDGGGTGQATGAAPQVVAERVVVFETRSAADSATSGATVVTLLVREREAARLSVYGAAGRLALVQVNARP